MCRTLLPNPVQLDLDRLCPLPVRERKLLLNQCLPQEATNRDHRQEDHRRELRSETTELLVSCGTGADKARHHLLDRRALLCSLRIAANPVLINLIIVLGEIGTAAPVCPSSCGSLLEITSTIKQPSAQTSTCGSSYCAPMMPLHPKSVAFSVILPRESKSSGAMYLSPSWTD